MLYKIEYYNVHTKKDEVSASQNVIGHFWTKIVRTKLSDVLFLLSVVTQDAPQAIKNGDRS